MMIYHEKLKNVPLFYGVNQEQIDAVLHELDAQIVHYSDGTTVHHIGDLISAIGIVLEGEIQMTSEDFWGNKSLVMAFNPGDFYGDAHSITREPVFFNLVAHKDTVLLMIDPNEILFPGRYASPGRYIIQQNMVRIIEKKKIGYMHSVDCLMKRSIREKLLAFLSEQARRSGSSAFYINYNRHQLADHLAMDASAMSRELSRMRDDGLLDFSRNFFDLHYLGGADSSVNVAEKTAEQAVSR